MDNYMELAQKYLLRKESKKKDVLKEICEIDYSDIDSKWKDKKEK